MPLIMIIWLFHSNMITWVKNLLWVGPLTLYYITVTLVSEAAVTQGNRLTVFFSKQNCVSNSQMQYFRSHIYIYFTHFGNLYCKLFTFHDHCFDHWKQFFKHFCAWYTMYTIVTVVVTYNMLVHRTMCTVGCTMQIRNPVICYTGQGSLYKS